MPLNVTYLFLLLIIIYIFGIFIGRRIERGSRWNYCAEKLPSPKGRAIINYPVAFFDEEFGVILDQAEYHPNRANKWLSVPGGDVCHPYAWYDLSVAPHPV